MRIEKKYSLNEHSVSSRFFKSPFSRADMTRDLCEKQPKWQTYNFHYIQEYNILWTKKNKTMCLLDLICKVLFQPSSVLVERTTYKLQFEVRDLSYTPFLFPCIYFVVVYCGRSRLTYCCSFRSYYNNFFTIISVSVCHL